jgi:hypothetical protein
MHINIPINAQAVQFHAYYGNNYSVIKANM